MLSWELRSGCAAGWPRRGIADVVVYLTLCGQPVPPLSRALHELKLTGRAVLYYMPHLAFVQKYGLDDCEAAIRLQAELTKRFTAEFSIG